MDKSLDKKKFLTFSYDDGVTQDIRLIDIRDEWGRFEEFHGWLL